MNYFQMQRTSSGIKAKEVIEFSAPLHSQSFIIFIHPFQFQTARPLLRRVSSNSFHETVSILLFPPFVNCMPSVPLTLPGFNPLSSAIFFASSIEIFSIANLSPRTIYKITLKSLSNEDLVPVQSVFRGSSSGGFSKTFVYDCQEPFSTG